jgi:hypothetical protein
MLPRNWKSSVARAMPAARRAHRRSNIVTPRSSHCATLPSMVRERALSVPSEAISEQRSAYSLPLRVHIATIVATVIRCKSATAIQ